MSYTLINTTDVRTGLPTTIAAPRCGGPAFGGTSIIRLREAYTAARNAAEAALRALSDTAPNGRDYDAEALQSAEQEHETRMRWLQQICNDMAALEEWTDACDVRGVV